MVGAVSQQVDALCSQGRLQDAHDLLQRAASAGNSDALLKLAVWRVDGLVVARDLGFARHLLSKASLAGHSGAAVLHAYFLANGTGGPCDWSAAHASLRNLAKTDAALAEQVTLLDAMDIRPDGVPAMLGTERVLSVSPHVSLFDRLLTSDEAAYIQKASAPYLQPSVIVDPNSGKLMHNPIRRSDDAIFGVFNEDLVISAINKRVAVASGSLTEQGEPLTVLRYARGGEYRAHSDALSGTDNQRIATMILYLNTDYEGGQTQFLQTGLSVRGRVGDALLFRNVKADGRPDPRSRHAGLPITQGVKWIATRWIRSRKFVYPAPRPALG